MFDIGWTELVVIAVVAIIVIGPKDLPVVLRTVGAWARRARALMREFQGGVEEILRESEVESLRREIDSEMRDKPAEPPRAISPPAPPKPEAEASGDNKPKS
jgi:sec-independent protein translocase protein TatB